MFLIFTDLDGTLLDPETYGWEPALPAIDLCRRMEVPIILVSSKTRAEIDVLRTRLGLTSPFISENGGAIFFPKEGIPSAPPGTAPSGDVWKWALGQPYEVLVRSLREIRETLGWNLKGFSDMTLEEISRLTGLDPESCRLAVRREYDEPFMVLEQGDDLDMSPMFEAARQRGLTITVGGRFHHLQGRNDKGVAVSKLIHWYRERHPAVTTIALGDSPNDFTMLKQVYHPVLVRSSREFPGLSEQIPGLRTTHEWGPLGWNEAVLDILGVKSKGGTG